MINLDSITNDNNKEHNKKFILDHLYRILIIAGSWSGKTNGLLSLIKENDDIDKVYLYAKDLSELKYEFLIKKHDDVGIKYCNDPNAFVVCSNRMDDVYRNMMSTTQAEKEKF